MAAKTLEKSVSLTDSDVQTYLEGKENQNTKRKTESYVFSSFGNGISTTEIFATGRLILHCFCNLLLLETLSISHALSQLITRAGLTRKLFLLSFSFFSLSFNEGGF